MKDISGTIELKGKEYPMYFNLNVMEQIQDEYGSIDDWAKLTDGANGEPNAKAVIFGFTQMINEGIDIKNEYSEIKEPFVTHKQVGRMLTEYGLAEATKQLNKSVVESTQSDSKNV